MHLYKKYQDPCASYLPTQEMFQAIRKESCDISKLAQYSCAAIKASHCLMETASILRGGSSD